MTLEELKRDYEAMSEDLQDVAFSDVTAYITALEAECERLRGSLAKFTESHPRPDRVAIEPMKNPHIIVGENRRCLCGMYEGRNVFCRDVIEALDDLFHHAHIRGSGVSLYVTNIELLDRVIRPLVQECDEAELSKAKEKV